MKKGLLFLFALTLGVVTSQAQVSKAVQLSKSAPQKMQKMNFSKESVAPLMQKSSRRAAGDVSMMYSYPMGAFYYGLTDDASMYAAMQMLTGAFDDTEFTNYSSIENADGKKDRLTDVTWDWGTYDDGDPITPIAQRTDEYGSLIAQAFGFMQFPTVKYGDQSYQYTVAGSNGNTYTSGWTAGTEGLADFTFGDGNGGTEVHKGTVGNYIPGLGMYSGFGNDHGFISNKTFYNLEGYTALKPWHSTGKKLTGFAEYYVKPVSHVYAESVVAWYWFEGVTNKKEPLGGKTVTATIYTFDETNNTLKEYASATATDADVVIVSEENAMCSIEFKFTESDPFMGDVDAPIVLPDEDFIVMVTGFGDVTGNFTSPITSADGFTGFGYAILEDGAISTIGYTNDAETPQVSLPIGFRAALPVATYADVNLPTVLFTDEGGVGAGMKDEEGFYGFSIIYTMSKKDMWETVEKPDWITEIEFDDDYVEERGNMFITMTAEALPSGTDERSGKVVLELFGKQLEIPVYQSPNALGVKNITLDSNNGNTPAYNLAGQRVNNDYKGLVIKNGRKFVNK